MTDGSDSPAEAAGSGQNGAGGETVPAAVVAGASTLADPVDTPAEPAKPNGKTNGKTNGKAEDHWAHKFAAGVDDELTKEWLPTASRYLTPADKIKADIELRKNAVFLPKDDAKPEAWDAIYERLGRPKTAKDYKWNHLADAPALEEPDLAVREGYGEVAHRLGMSQKQIDGNVQWHDMNRKVQTDAFIARANITAETHTKTLKSTLGPDYDKTVGLHAQAVKSYAGADLKTMTQMRLEDGTYVLDHPAFVMMFGRIGAERSEDSRFAESFNPTGLANAKAQISQIEAEAIKLGLNPASPAWPHDKLKPLYGRAYGSKPLPVGRGG